MLNYFNDVYEQLHLVMGYDGFGSEKMIEIGFESAEKLIAWAESRAN